MSSNRTTSVGAVVLALVICGLISVSAHIPSWSKKFPVTHNNPVIRVGFENDPATVTVQASPAIRWEQVPAGNKALGYFFLLLVVISFYGVANDWHEVGIPINSKTSRAWLALAMVIVPIVASVLAFFLSYETSWLAQKEVNIPLDVYDSIKDSPSALKALFIK